VAPNERPFVLRQPVRLVQHLRWDDELPDVVQQRTDAIPEHRWAGDPHVRRDRAGEVGDALAVTMRVQILRFDRLAPSAHDVDELRLETTCAAGDIRDAGRTLELGERPIRPIQCDDRLAMTILPVIELGTFGGNLRPKDRVIAVAKRSLGGGESLLGASEIAALASDHRGRSRRGGSRTRIANPSRGIKRALATGLGAIYVTPPSEQFRVPELGVEHDGGFAKRARHRYRFVEGGVRRVPSACIVVQLGDRNQGCGEVEGLA
jgi:hypothetical protein